VVNHSGKLTEGNRCDQRRCLLRFRADARAAALSEGRGRVRNAGAEFFCWIFSTGGTPWSRFSLEKRETRKPSGLGELSGIFESFPTTL
jgi:hypothetical protein